MKDVDFSIVIPAYNTPELLQRALESVRSQHNVTWEAIIVDDSDKTSEIEQYVTTLKDPRIAYYHNRPPLGAVPNWNYGLSLANGRYVILLHHDESLLNEDFLSIMRRKLANCEIAVARVVVYRSDRKKYETAPKWLKKMVLHLPSLFFAINPIGPSAAFAFRIEHMKYFDTQTHWFVDVEWYYRMLCHSSACYVPSAIVASYHGHGGQISGNIDTVAEAKKDATVLNRKYRRNLPVRLFMWFFIHIIHNRSVNQTIKHLLRR